MPEIQAQQGEELQKPEASSYRTIVLSSWYLFPFSEGSGHELTAALLLQNRIQFAILSLNLSLKHM